MHLVYIDDSKDKKSVCFSGIMLPVGVWLEAFNFLIETRRKIKASHGIYTRTELHATDWIGGRGNVAPGTVVRTERVKLFNFMLAQIVKLPGVSILNAHGPRASEDELFKRLIQRIENTAKARKSHALVISDEGKNYDFLLRKMRRHNYIPSALGAWADGSSSKNIPAEHLVEDIVYRDSKRSLFIQAADFCAFSLLRFEDPTPKAISMGFDQSFLILEPALLKIAFKADPRKLGIIRA
ncbi:DUF3800 domain-containing protein [Blastomonas sp. UPD001]|uniref:DUF3800 domain-containing protein n=1 Tax=Blastomonas sp. UPD001 TaxID=2217673 RepID=UPI000E34E3C4|nr:DUF3800 domain-containing protein [Blastomonas sp. UPD001]